MNDIFLKLRGYFGIDNVYIGGSYVYTKELGLEWNKKDVDIFILIPRMESWALVNTLNDVFDKVIIFNNFESNLKLKNEYYFIEKQWKRVICYKDDMCYDLIFVDTDFSTLVNENTGSTISKLYYNIPYNINKPVLTHSSLFFKKSAMDNKNCIIDYKKCTDAYASKMVDICNKLGYTYGR